MERHHTRDVRNGTHRVFSRVHYTEVRRCYNVVVFSYDSMTNTNYSKANKLRLTGRVPGHTERSRPCQIEARHHAAVFGVCFPEKVWVLLARLQVTQTAIGAATDNPLACSATQALFAESSATTLLGLG